MILSLLIADSRASSELASSTTISGELVRVGSVVSYKPADGTTAKGKVVKTKAVNVTVLDVEGDTVNVQVGDTVVKNVQFGTSEKTWK